MGAIVVGCLSPDFEYFLRLRAIGSYGHTIGGLFWFDLPLSLAVLALWHRYVASALRTLAPGLFPIDPVRKGAKPLGANVKELLITCGSALIGATTHLVWDSFTHPVFWPYRHFQVLRETVGFGMGLVIPTYKILQHGSTLFGMIILLTWWARWIHGDGSDRRPFFQPSAWLLLSGALALALARVLLPLAFARHLVEPGIMLSSFVVTCITALWVELVWFGHTLTATK